MPSNDDERAVMRRLFQERFDGRSIAQCLRSLSVPRTLKIEYLRIMAERYPPPCTTVASIVESLDVATRREWTFWRQNIGQPDCRLEWPGNGQENQMSDAATFAEFDREISEIEGRLAYGSETSVYGHFVHRMGEIGGAKWRESDQAVPQDELAWWRKAYDLYATDQELALDEQATDIQDIFDRV